MWSSNVVVSQVIFLLYTYRWLDTGEDDGLIEREVLVQGAGKFHV